MNASLIFVVVTSENQVMGASWTSNGEMPLILSSLVHAFTAVASVTAVMRCLGLKCFVSSSTAALRPQRLWCWGSYLPKWCYLHWHHWPPMSLSVFPFSSQIWNSGRDYFWDGTIRRQYFLFSNMILLRLVSSPLSLNDWTKGGCARPIHPIGQSRFQLACFLASSLMLVLACLLQRWLSQAQVFAYGFVADHICALIRGRAIFSSHL